MSKFCTSCGTQQSADAQFCENCGASLARPAETPPPAAAAPAPASPGAAAPPAAGKGFPVMLVVGGLVGLLAVGGLIALLFSAGGGGPAATAEDFFRAVEEGNVEQARGMMASDMRMLLNDQKLNMAMAQNQNKVQQRGGLQDIEILEETINDQQAFVKLRLVYGDGYTEVQNAKLIQEDGDWKVTADK